MAFPSSNLPSSVQPWSRDVQNRIETLERNVKANEVNGMSRDVQLSTNYKRIDKLVNDLIVADENILQALEDADTAITASSNASAQALSASTLALGASSTANTAAGQASTAATTANDAAIEAHDAAVLAQGAADKALETIAILQSLTTSSYFNLQYNTWTGTNDFYAEPVDYTGTTNVDIPEAGGQRNVIITATFDVDMRSTTTATGVAAVQTAIGRILGSSSQSINSANSGIALFNAGTITARAYGGSTLVVTGTLNMTASGVVSWRPYITIQSQSNGTYSGSANLRSVVVTITKV